MNRNQHEKAFLRQLASLPREIAPARDAWPSIAARLAPATTGGNKAAAWRFRLWPLATAASVFMLVAAGVLMQSQWRNSTSASAGGDSAMTPVAPSSGPYSANAGTAGELEYQAALREFMALNALPETAAGLKPEWIEQGWGTLRQVELQLSAALRDEPDNEFLHSRMAALRARQIEWLKQIAAMDQWSNTT
jgi:hypothetical protein